MMGQLSSGQERLFYSFNLEDHIPANHLLRSIDQCLDLSDLRHYLADFYSPIGRPSIDPELMIRMLADWLELTLKWFAKTRLRSLIIASLGGSTISGS